MIREAIQSIAGTSRKSYPCFLAKVLSVDENENMCDVEPLNGDADMFDVRFRSELGSTAGFFAVPKIGSTVLVCQTSDTSGVVVCYSSVEKISLMCDGEDNEGLVKVDYLFNRLRQIEQGLEQFKAMLTAHVHPSAGVPSPQLLSPLMPNFGTTIKNDLQNDKVVH